MRLGLSPCFLYPDPSRTVFGPKTLTYFENEMVRYIGDAGFEPHLIPLMDNLEQLEIDGLVLQGGSDIAPESYGETPIGEWRGDLFRDRYELRLIEHAVKRGIPVFGICRGFQLLNVYFGGSLYQDLQTQRAETRSHRDAGLYDTVAHEVSICPGGFLSGIYPERISVNTVHHQGIKELGSGLEVEAVSSEDGIIESFSGEEVLGVQWHPEFSHTLGNEVADPLPLLQRFFGSSV